MILDTTIFFQYQKCIDVLFIGASNFPVFLNYCSTDTIILEFFQFNK